MNDELKTHAKEYLVDFSKNQSDWLRYLIFEAINTNGKISVDKLDEIYSCLKEGKNVQLPHLHANSTTNALNICLKKLEHISGVNALAAAQTIKFSDDVTVLYGLNGAGKSSYFKVLNEIVGGNEKKEILSNIHADQAESIQVKLTYSDGNSNELTFDNSERGVEALAGCKVFDSSYLTGLLSQRTQDETILEPLGLHLFKYIADRVDTLKSRLKEDAGRLRNSKPSISYDKFSDQLKGEFEAHNVSEQAINLLNEKFVFTVEKAQQLEGKQNELAALKQTNYADRITVLNTENDDLRKISDFLKKKDELEAFPEKTTQLLNQKQKKEDANKKALEKIAVLKELHFSGTDEWKEFISAGAKLKEQHQTDSKTCIYCNQPLQEDAFKLVQAYSEYLGDKTGVELQTAKSNLMNARKELEGISVSLDISDSFKQKYKDIYLENNINLLTTLDQAQKAIEGFKPHLLGFIDENGAEKPKITVDPNVSTWITNKLNKNSGDIETLNTNIEKKNEKIVTLEKEIKELSENKSISEQKDKIENWVRIDKEEKVLRKKESEINTNTVTRLSNTAHDNLLTSELDKSLKDELDHLGYKNLEVNLVKAKGGKGSNSTKLILKDTDSIHSILSEGEQKAVGLALFIAEAVIQKSQSPIILDDPVNSLDHKIATNLANRLLSLENQLIIFNHNRLFQDAFETAKSGHICKTIDSACNKQGKHILVYDVSSEGKSRKGVLSFHKANNFKNHIITAKKELENSPFTEHTKVSALLRKAAECLVDETVLNGVTPTKYSNKNNRIHWDKLKDLKCSPDGIEKIQNVHNRVSGGDLHNGTESESNRIDVDEFNELVADLESVAGGNSHD
jgi:energy-coupling factor transporter ATP-binding protein EcfA2